MPTYQMWLQVGPNIWALDHYTDDRPISSEIHSKRIYDFYHITFSLLLCEKINLIKLLAGVPLETHDVYNDHVFLTVQSVHYLVL